MRIIYEDAARQEGMEAAAWYEQQQQGLGTRFLTQWKNAENRMVANPEIHRCIQGELRKCRFVIFPYALVFRTCGDDLQVLAIMHMRRKPGYWNKRD